MALFRKPVGLSLRRSFSSFSRSAEGERVGASGVYKTNPMICTWTRSNREWRGLQGNYESLSRSDRVSSPSSEMRGTM